MTAPPIIQAEVIDITLDTPKPGDLFLADTNVWIWLTYPPATLPGFAATYQADAYPDYIDRARRATATLAHPALAFAELAAVIERIAWRTYLKTHQHIPLKNFRRLPQERALVVQSIEAAWEQMNQFSAPASLVVDLSTAQDALDRVSSFPLEGYDALFLVAAEKEGITQVLTDDSDFAFVPGIQLFTANPLVLAMAHQQGKLVTR